MIFQDFLENRVAKKIQEQNTNILQSLSSENSDTIQMEGREFELFLKKREIEFLIEYFFAKHLSQMMLRFGEDIISNKLIFMPILKGGVYLESIIKVFSRLHFISSEFIGMQSYFNGKKKENKQYLDCDKKIIENNHIILIDEIIDSGETLTKITENIFSKNPASISFFIAINKVDPQKKQALKKNFDQYGVYTTAIQCPYDYWAIGTLLGLDNNQFCRATLDHLYIEKKDKKPALETTVILLPSLSWTIVVWKRIAPAIMFYKRLSPLLFPREIWSLIFEYRLNKTTMLCTKAVSLYF